MFRERYVYNVCTHVHVYVYIYMYTYMYYMCTPHSPDNFQTSIAQCINMHMHAISIALSPHTEYISAVIARPAYLAR